MNIKKIRARYRVERIGGRRYLTPRSPWGNSRFSSIAARVFRYAFRDIAQVVQQRG